MKSLIFYKPGDIRLEEMPKPAAGPKDAVIRVARAGICGSDLKAYLFDGHSVGILNKGEFGVDGQFGHEMVGTVEEVGSETEGICVGDRVFVNPMRCKRNGMLSCDMSGAFSEYVLAEDAAYGYNLRKLQDHVSFDQAVLTEPLGVATHGKNIIGIKPWENVVIYGGGTIGLCALAAAVAAGCRKPVLIDHHDDRLEKAELIRREREGIGKPNRIYVRIPDGGNPTVRQAGNRPSDGWKTGGQTGGIPPTNKNNRIRTMDLNQRRYDCSDEESL